MKRNRIWLFLVFLLCAGQIMGCAQTTPEKEDKSRTEDKVSIVCTTFPSYDWTRELLRGLSETADLTLLVNNGVDLHSYQATAEDIVTIGAADIFIYVGGESDSWIAEALQKTSNKEMVVINLLETLGEGAKIEEMVEGMQEDEHGHEHEETSAEVHDDVYDEHIWLSLKNAQILVGHLSDALQEVMPNNQEQLKKNEAAYRERLAKLDERYEQAMAESKFNTLIFGDRLPFRYLIDDYGLNYYAAFSGCSAQTEASFETIAFLSGKADEVGASSIMVIESSDQKIAETIKQNTREKNQDILVLNSIQSVTEKDMNNGFSYIQAMEDNLEVFKQALN